MKLEIFAAALLLSTSAACAGETTIYNNSGVPIDELYTSAPGKAQWGDNLLRQAPEGSLDNGKSYRVSGLASGVWDLRIEAPDEGVSCVIRKVHVEVGPSFEITPALGKTCN